MHELQIAALARQVVALERQIAALQRRLGLHFALARSTLVPNDSGPVQTVQLQLDALSARDNVTVLYNYGFSAVPPVACDMHVAYLDGDRSKAVAVASGHQSYRPRNLGLGDSMLYDIRGAALWLASTGPVVNCAGRPMTVQGDLHVTGAIIAGYGGSDQVGVQTHTHGVVSGATTAPRAGT